MIAPTPGSLIRFARQQMVIWFLKYIWRLIRYQFRNSLELLKPHCCCIVAFCNNSKTTAFHHQNVSIPMACTATSWWLSGAKRSCFALLRRNLIWIDIWKDKKKLSLEIPQLKVNLNVSKGSQLTNSMGKILYLILNVAWKISKKNFKNIPNSQAFQDIPRYSKCFCHLHQPQIGKRSQLLRPRPPPRHIASAALVHGWFLIRLSVMWLVETMLKLWNWCKNVRCSLSLSMFARSEHVLNQSILMDPFGFLRQRFFWSTSFTQVHERKERQCFYWRHPVKKDPS